MIHDIGLLIIRIVVGLYVAGHGAQKLFGWFDGPGLAQFTDAIRAMRLRPAPFWALMAGITEFGGGSLMALGLFSPLGELGIVAAMIIAIIKGHWGTGPWALKGGWELALTYLAAALAIAFTGPGAYSLDRVFHIALPAPSTLWIGLGGVIVGVMIALLGQTAPESSRKPA